ncbi:MAG: hypothetical protein LH632_05235 [Rhodoferax sp.]|nr:hypothetical protein [Rhodoferax sp.]
MFARAWVEMKAIKTIIHLRREKPARIKSMVPAYVWTLVQPNGLVQSACQSPGQTAAALKSASG